MLLLGAVSRHSQSRIFIALAPMIALTGAVYSGLTGDVGFGFLLAFVVAFDVDVVVAFDVAFTVAVTVVAFVVVGGAVVFLYLGFVLNQRQGARAVFASPTFNTGIDILSVMLGALGIASLFANPPIW